MFFSEHLHPNPETAVFVNHYTKSPIKFCDRADFLYFTIQKAELKLVFLLYTV